MEPLIISSGKANTQSLLIIIKKRIDALPPIDKLAETAIIGYLAHLVREERVEQIHFLLA